MKRDRSGILKLLGDFIILDAKMIPLLHRESLKTEYLINFNDSVDFG